MLSLRDDLKLESRSMPQWIVGLVWILANHLIITGSNVRLRSEPQTTATEVSRFALGTIVEELGTSQDRQWRQVAAPDGKTGWVFAMVQRYTKINEQKSR